MNFYCKIYILDGFLAVKYLAATFGMGGRFTTANANKVLVNCEFLRFIVKKKNKQIICKARRNVKENNISLFEFEDLKCCLFFL